MWRPSNPQRQEVVEPEDWLGRDPAERQVLSRSMGAALVLHATIAIMLLAGFTRAPVRVEKRHQSMRVQLSRIPAASRGTAATRGAEATVLPRLPRLDPTLGVMDHVTVTFGPPAVSDTLPSALPGAMTGLPEGPQDIGGGPVRVSAGQAPGLVRRVEPVYPSVARAARIEGIVVVDAVIRMDGTVSDVTVLRTSNPMFNQPCVDAVRKWRFTSGPQDVILTVTVNFTLR
jgi:TonB family protein